MYRRTARSRALVERLQRGREAARMQRPLEPRPEPRPDLRMQIIVRRFDCGSPIEHTFDFRDMRRVDLYRVQLDGQPWQSGIGLSRALALIRKALPRLPSDRRGDMISRIYEAPP